MTLQVLRHRLKGRADIDKERAFAETLRESSAEPRVDKVIPRIYIVKADGNTDRHKRMFMLKIKMTIDECLC